MTKYVHLLSSPNALNEQHHEAVRAVCGSLIRAEGVRDLARVTCPRCKKKGLSAANTQPAGVGC